ncbi:hypothetical protein PsorP6_018191 [Peronosclerospora sorghi]|uniref:Uncharacterized protein n=1 Tax=Peronosclerospora sorghi TaxID=230839 RepID=A0ACC0WFU5_9STRA|nr:hypothetical protein PsorP6_018191 [Peronosclerospora sorghi]
MVSPFVWNTQPHDHKWVLCCGWALSFTIGLVLTGYIVFHLWLLREGKTTLEFLAGKQGELTYYSFTHNVAVYFGRAKWSWWIPTTPLLDTDTEDLAEDDAMETVLACLE